MGKRQLLQAIVLMAVFAFCFVEPSSAQEQSATTPVASTSSAESVEKINQEIEALAIELMRSLPSTGTYAVKNANDSSSGVPEDLLAQMTSSLQSSLIAASNFSLTLIDQAQLEESWANAVEFNGADFETMVAQANFDALIILNTRATPTGLEISLQAVGATSSDAGQILASTKLNVVNIDWNAMSGVDVAGIDEKLANLDQKIEDVAEVEVDTPSFADISYSRYVGSKECLVILSKMDNPTDPCSEQNSLEDKIVAKINGKRLIADEGIEKSERLNEIGWIEDGVYIDEIFWSGDFDNDGYEDVLIGSNCGGSGCPPIYRLVLYRGEGKFSTLHLRPLHNANIKISKEAFHFFIKMTGSEDFHESSTKSSYLYLEYRVIDGELSEKDLGAQSNQFNLAEFSVEDAIKNSEDEINRTGPCGNFENELPCVSWEFDLNGDTAQEKISCDYWSRWKVLIDCEIQENASGVVYSVNSIDTSVRVSLGLPAEAPAQCKTIYILDELDGRFNKILCDFHEVKLIMVDTNLTKFFKPQQPPGNQLKSVSPEEATIAVDLGSVDVTRALIEAQDSLNNFSDVHNIQDKVFIQQLLKDKGFYTGPIDGDWGTGTMYAFRDLFVSLQAMKVNYSVNSLDDFVATILFVRDFQGKFILNQEILNVGTENVSSSPSFDCSLAVTADEIAICSNSELANLDLQVSEAFKMVKEAAGDDLAKEIARNALKERRACKDDVLCIQKVQILTLQQFESVFAQE
jgi:hypothetical protein